MTASASIYYVMRKPQFIDLSIYKSAKRKMQNEGVAFGDYLNPFA